MATQAQRGGRRLRAAGCTLAGAACLAVYLLGTAVTLPWAGVGCVAYSTTVLAAWPATTMAWMVNRGRQAAYLWAIAVGFFCTPISFALLVTTLVRPHPGPGAATLFISHVWGLLMGLALWAGMAWLSEAWLPEAWRASIYGRASETKGGETGEDGRLLRAVSCMLAGVACLAVFTVAALPAMLWGDAGLAAYSVCVLLAWIAATVVALVKRGRQTAYWWAVWVGGVVTPIHFWLVAASIDVHPPHGPAFAAVPLGFLWGVFAGTALWAGVVSLATGGRLFPRGDAARPAAAGGL